MRLNAKQLRDLRDEDAIGQFTQRERNPLYILLENVYDTYNIGGIFRLSDALNVQQLLLAGEMETPPNSRIMKASIGTYKIVPWEYHPSATAAIAALRRRHPEGIRVVAVEQDARAVDYRGYDYADREWRAIRKDQQAPAPAPRPICLVAGNETFGVLPETRALCDSVLEIPMWGVNKSLNVIVALAIVGYRAIEGYICTPKLALKR
ncbi:MAG: hypothetical protein N2691_02635 [Patescibacteria group bacterium]|nr:hypothetical protein [Patescibacteria group bacterium]